MPVREQHLKLLRPYFAGEQEKDNGEVDMHCPLHEDEKRSASLNVQEGVWYCNACEVGGRVAQLIRERDLWVDPPAAARNGRARRKREVPDITEGLVQGWVSALLANTVALEELREQRGLTEETILQYDIGWDSNQQAYTIPVPDGEGGYWNVRRYQLNPPKGRRKIWSHGSGYGEPRLYPVTVLDDDPRSIVVCEGELDALLTIQNGVPAITRTGAADVWEAEWGEHFAGRVVYLCHDADEKGEAANRKVGKALRHAAKDVRVLKLPYATVPKHGKDLTDFWLEHDRKDFKRMVKAAREQGQPEEAETLDPSDASVLESFDARKVGKPLRLTVTVKGKRDPGYSVPKRVQMECTRDAGDKCHTCPMAAAGGEDEFEIEPYDPAVLELIGSTKGQRFDILKDHYGAKCRSQLTIDVPEWQAVEQLFARPSVDHMNGSSADDYKNIKLTSVGRHDTLPNNTVQVVGALHPEPRQQLTEVLVWDVERLETSVDRFELNDETIEMMKRFQAGKRPLKKLADISREMATHVTHIYGRPEMHAAMDLVWHSALSFDFGRQRVHRGWLQMLVVGDTRTGKSEVAKLLMRHYGAGEMVNCESATIAGVVGGLQQYGNTKEWAITWGTLPINDRRLVVLDEVSGLSQDAIGQMSDVRSRGVAQLTKIQQEQTYARTRTIWLGNPRNAGMREYTYGVQAIRPLIGTNEDIARFDLAMSVALGEVPREEMNREHAAGTLHYTHEACATLVRWVWSRKPEQVVWADGAEQAVRDAANRMGARYVEDPPLVQGADVRIKIARVAVAMAGRLFSTDDTYENIVVRTEHVRDAVKFMDRLYGMPGFGYAERSREMLQDARDAAKASDDVRTYIAQKEGLAKFLRNTGSFKRQDIESMLNYDKDMANAVINTLYRARMVRIERGDVRVEPALHVLLREVK
jgi:hypothetical protein